MKILYSYAIILLALCMSSISYAQNGSQLIIADKITREPLPGSTIRLANGTVQIANAKGMIVVDAIDNTISVSATGYKSIEINPNHMKTNLVLLELESTSLDEVIITANRLAQKRTEAPVAISNITPTVINDTKATTIDQLVNKVSGVFMVNLGNEQHMMGIRQPMSTRSVYLYLEDGIPIRTSGVFNHNALLEMNMNAVKNIEVIRGPSSSMYGGEAIGGAINFISAAPASVFTSRVGIQGSTSGYRRADVSIGNTFGKLAISFNGYFAENRNGVLDYSDFKKFIGTLRADYQIDKNTSITSTITAMDYSSDMRGGLDSIAFLNKNYGTPQTFTFRDVEALRIKTQINKQWTGNSSSSLAFVFRDNSVKQNPAYSIKDDYRKVNGQFRGDPGLAHGEINDNYFKSYMLIATHRQSFFKERLNTISGVSVDYSPAGYIANYIRIKQDSISRSYKSFENIKDSSLSDYVTNLTSAGVFTQFDYRVSQNLKFIAGFRYDVYHMDYKNALPPSAFSGAGSTSKNFYRFTPKLGFTWEAFRNIGFYGNYSEGFVAPQITELFRGVKVPNLEPQTFYNYEAGGWISVLNNRIYADWSVYLLNGKNEIVSIRLDDGTNANANTGKTRHYGIEYGVTINPTNDLRFRLSAANSKHVFVQFVEKGISYNDNEMNNAPRFIQNVELIYKPKWLEGSRISAEYQHVGRYWQDPQNTARYNGFDVLNLRAGYEFRSIELWINLINLTNKYYATNASKSAFGYSYNIGDPRTLNVGVAYTFRKKSLSSK